MDKGETCSVEIEWIVEKDCVLFYWFQYIQQEHTSISI